MSHTQVFQLGGSAASALEERLRAELPTGEWRRVDHARFAVKVPGVNLVCYKSGKLVLQGKGIEDFASRFLDDAAAAKPKAKKDDAALPFEVATVGSDEAGKGDYFGPLVVASVFAAHEHHEELAAMGVADSKSLTDRRMYPLAERIENLLDCEVRVLMPADYNDRWQQLRNVNHLLADLHTDAIATLLSRNAVEQVIVDRFGSEQLISSRLKKRDCKVKDLVQVPRAEAHPVVAAASIVARVRFLEGLAQCQDEAGTDLHKGAGAPVDVVARKVFEIGGTELLQRTAKMHFKNSQRIPGLDT